MTISPATSNNSLTNLLFSDTTDVSPPSSPFPFGPLPPSPNTNHATHVLEVIKEVTESSDTTSTTVRHSDLHLEIFPGVGSDDGGENVCQKIREITAAARSRREYEEIIRQRQQQLQTFSASHTEEEKIRRYIEVRRLIPSLCLL